MSLKTSRDGMESGELVDPYSLKKNTMAKISTILKRTLNPKYRAMVEAGYLNSELKITDAGRTRLDHIVLQVHEDALAAAATELIAERKAKDADADDSE